jgi:hypothetical protein
MNERGCDIPDNMSDLPFWGRILHKMVYSLLEANLP